MYLKRVSAWQKLNSRSVYNEMIVEGAGRSSTWASHLPDTIEAFFQVKEPSSIRSFHDKFLRAYGLDGNKHPLLQLDARNWEHPFTKA